MASGICQIQVGGMQKTAAETARIARERSAVGIVVGLPVNMDGLARTALGSCGKICPSAGRGFRITGRTAGRAYDHYGGIPLPQRD